MFQPLELYKKPKQDKGAAWGSMLANVLGKGLVGAGVTAALAPVAGPAAAPIGTAAATAVGNTVGDLAGTVAGQGVYNAMDDSKPGGMVPSFAPQQEQKKGMFDELLARYGF